MIELDDKFIDKLDDDMFKEQWKAIMIKGQVSPYSISTKGRVVNNLTGEILKQYDYGCREKKYSMVYLPMGKNIRFGRVHRLVAEAFIPNPENKPQVNHKDGNKKNNNVENLEWCTNSENVKHAISTGLLVYPKGEDSSRHKFSSAQVHEACRLMKEGVSMRAISKRLNVTYAFLTGIRSEGNWKEIADQYDIKLNWKQTNRSYKQKKIIDELISNGIRNKSLIYKAADLEKNSANYNYIKWRIKLFNHDKEAFERSTTISEESRTQVGSKWEDEVHARVC